jgi:hypothetical protein
MVEGCKAEARRKGVIHSGGEPEGGSRVWRARAGRVIGADPAGREGAWLRSAPPCKLATLPLSPGVRARTGLCPSVSVGGPAIRWVTVCGSGCPDSERLGAVSEQDPGNLKTRRVHREGLRGRSRTAAARASRRARRQGRAAPAGTERALRGGGIPTRTRAGSAREAGPGDSPSRRRLGTRTWTRAQSL